MKVHYNGRIDENQLVIAEVHNYNAFTIFMRSLPLRPPFIVKPNWICKDYGHFTDPQVLAWILRWLHEQGEVILVESYSARNMMKLPTLNLSPIFSSNDLELVRRVEKAFLAETGIQDVLQETKVEYINITEEVLAKRTIDEDTVKQVVERHYPPVLNKELYQFVPKRLYDLRSGTFINLAKFKVFFSMCTKNMFGMIPEYVGYDSRYKAYHGKNDKDLSRNIVDINKIYHSLFNVCGVVEAVHSLSYNIGDVLAKRRSDFGYRYDVLERSGMIYYCDNPLYLDAFIHRQCGKDPKETKHLKDAGEMFGLWTPELIQTGKNLSNPIPV